MATISCKFVNSLVAKDTNFSQYHAVCDIHIIVVYSYFKIVHMDVYV